MYKAQMSQKVQMVQSKPRQSIDISPKAISASWFNDDKFKNMKIYINEAVLHKPTAHEIETQEISGQDISLRKQEIEDEYSTELEIKKIADKNRIEAKKLELEAMSAPLSVDIPPPPGTQAKAGEKQSSKDDLSGGLNEMMNMVKSAGRQPSCLRQNCRHWQG